MKRLNIHNSPENSKECTFKMKRLNINSPEIMKEGADMISRDIVFFDYITIERVELELTNWNSEMSIAHCMHAEAWL